MIMCNGTGPRPHLGISVILQLPCPNTNPRTTPADHAGNRQHQTLLRHEVNCFIFTQTQDIYTGRGNTTRNRKHIIRPTHQGEGLQETPTTKPRHRTMGCSTWQ
ncbi:unnamed protein product [Staurois parvus]|uniref:Uncharacterized protein n=1 Tax=Staurois parvus TaxID=386267 RepID=A0ABN9HH16_9NEOB|nr:unnamed protein product [Staurois parvus]